MRGGGGGGGCYHLQLQVRWSGSGDDVMKYAKVTARKGKITRVELTERGETILNSILE